MDKLNQLSARAVERLRAFRAQNPQLFKLLAAAAGLSALLCAVFYLLSPGAPVVLASNLAAADRTALALRLRHNRIDFTLGPDSVSVPANEITAARALLARSPVFDGGVDGFPLFDQPSMGLSDFDQQVNYQRAQQGELERTLMDMRGIESARVMLAMGRPAPFALGPGEAERASVMLTTAPGAVIDPASARAIAHLVAGSVRGLAVENVVITGNDGALLYPPPHEGEYGEALRLRDDLERRLQEKIALLLNRIMGENRFAAEVAVTIDNSRVVSHDRLFGKGGQAVLSEEHSITPAGMEASGVPGLTSNLPGAKPSASPAPAPQSTASPAAQTKPEVSSTVSAADDAARKDIVNYKPSSRDIHTVTAPVRVQRISVAVVLDGTYDGGRFKPLPPDRMNAIEGLLAAAIGADKERGDSVEVQCAPLSQPYVPPVPDPLTQVRAYFSNPIHLYEAAGAALLLLVFLAWLLKRMIGRLFGRKRRQASAAEDAPAQHPAPAEAQAAPAEQPAPALAPPPSEYEQVRAQLNEVAGREPEAGAAVLRKWLEAALQDSDGAPAGRLVH